MSISGLRAGMKKRPQGARVNSAAFCRGGLSARPRP